MMSYSAITIFSDHTDLSQRSTSFAVSVLIHCLVLGPLFFGLMYAPRIVNGAQSERYPFRQIALQTPPYRTQQSSRTDTSPDSLRSASAAPSAADTLAAYLQAMRKIENAGAGTHILLQPEVHSRITVLRETDIPSFIIWMPDSAQVKHIVAPFESQPRAATVTPSVSTPNAEMRPADIAIRSTDRPASDNRSVAGTSSPVTLQEPDLPQMAPLTVTEVSEKPTPIAVMSVSDLRIVNGTAILPPVNQSAGSKGQDGLTLGQSANRLTNNERADGKASGTQKGQGSSDRPNAHDPGLASGNSDAFSPGERPSATLISLPKNGHFESVVVGASLEDQFPEIEGFWGGRLLYTAYLHVGLAQSWILQYSLPRSDTAVAAGNLARLESPWPYSIVRPDLAPGSINADALMIKGSISQDGHFEEPTLIFPPAFPLAQFVVNCLRQWQFRPAFQNGQPARVEILLIIPDSE